MNIQDNIDQANNFQEEESHSSQKRESINNHNEEPNNSIMIKQSIKQGQKAKDAQVSFQSNTKTEDESEQQSQSQSEEKRRVIRKKKIKAQNHDSEQNNQSQNSSYHDGIVRFKDSSEDIVQDQQKKRKINDNMKDQINKQDGNTDNNHDDNDNDDDDDDDENEQNENYIVEKIIKKRIKNKKCEYYVKWQGYPSNKNTWEPLSNLENVKDMIYQYEYDLPQTGKQPKVNKQILKNLDHTKIERIFGHDRIGKKSEYLVSYTGIPKPLWVLKHDLPISYYKQYESKLSASDPVCIIQQIKQTSNEKESIQKRGRKPSVNSSEIENSFSKKNNNQLFSSRSMEEQEDEVDDLNDEENQEKSKQISDKAKRGKKAIVSDVESNSIPQSIAANKIKRGRPKKKPTPNSQNSSIVNNSQIEDESILNSKPKKKVKIQQQEKQSISSKSQQDTSSINENNLDNTANLNNTTLLQQINVQAIKNDQQILVKRESYQDSSDATQMQNKNFNENYPKEGSFEAKDKVQRVIIRSSEKELEAMIFEVFWKPRPDGQQPRSKLVRYEELKKNSPESLIYWLEVMVKNSVKELESDDVIIKELKEKVQQLEQQIQNITITTPTRQNIQQPHNILPFHHMGIPQNLQFTHQQLQDMPIHFQNNQEQKFVQFSNNELLKAKFNNQNQGQQLLQNKNR
ncbi:chromodomain protein (macronuclear) [Tetrahymena thermophila SB210]|uniref:Chromodomain protein n=1 Tax=Tetrahymena thermophila (strain SB210) TaxID=312017 RepID=I7MDQ9_TETTS|nr:chromodomain protein [Tetrahymena thermophila SB210]EAR90777.2 chromodomain protein [Tetrahymena thermophila SB210]|eukprot:XP_001011022.2 chromodomain protein [Tetrahymena thermophila SB210]